MKVIYLYPTPYSKPSAAVNRILLFVKGLNQNGIKSEIVFVNTFIGYPKLIRLVFHLCALLFTYIKYFLSKNNKIIVYGENSLWLLIKFPRLAEVFLERNEYPSYLIDQHYKNKPSRFEPSKINNFDGLITCSNVLAQYYGQFLSSESKIFISPVIVDNEMFNLNTKIEKKISYCGDWGNNKDGVDILIKSFSLLVNKHNDFKLELIGGSTSDVESSLEQLVSNLGIIENVIFAGRIPHEEMPSHLCSASILALARPDNKQAQGGFPSKISEYLATGRPVVVTNVGELHLFLKDRENCYMSVPDSYEAFAEKLCQVIEDGKEAEIVGLKGKQLSSLFGYKIQAHNLSEFLINL